MSVNVLVAHPVWAPLFEAFERAYLISHAKHNTFDKADHNRLVIASITV